MRRLTTILILAVFTFSFGTTFVVGESTDYPIEVHQPAEEYDIEKAPAWVDPNEVNHRLLGTIDMPWGQLYALEMSLNIEPETLEVEVGVISGPEWATVEYSEELEFWYYKFTPTEPGIYYVDYEVKNVTEGISTPAYEPSMEKATIAISVRPRSSSVGFGCFGNRIISE